MTLVRRVANLAALIQCRVKADGNRLSQYIHIL
jgi:hypothetical protein